MSGEGRDRLGGSSASAPCGFSRTVFRAGSLSRPEGGDQPVAQRVGGGRRGRPGRLGLACLGVDSEPIQPEPQAAQVDVGDRRVAELEIERRLDEVERRVTCGGLVAPVEGVSQRENVAQSRTRAAAAPSPARPPRGGGAPRRAPRRRPVAAAALCALRPRLSTPRGSGPVRASVGTARRRQRTPGAEGTT